jgi:hypothetical protein
MTKTILIYRQLKALGIIGADQFKTLTVKLLAIEMRFNGSGYTLITSDKKLSPNGRFNVLNNQMLSIIAVATATGIDDITPSVIRHFIKSVNNNADVSKIELELTYHDCIVDKEITADEAMVAIVDSLKVGEKYSLTEGYENKAGERFAFKSAQRINTYKVLTSVEADEQFEFNRQAIDVAVEVQHAASKAKVQRRTTGTTQRAAQPVAQPVAKQLAADDVEINPTPAEPVDASDLEDQP